MNNIKVITDRKNEEDTPTVYLFVNRSNEADLCMRFTAEVRQSLDVYVPDFTSFSEMFRFLMDLGKRMQYKKSGQMIFSDRLIYKYC